MRRECAIERVSHERRRPARHLRGVALHVAAVALPGAPDASAASLAPVDAGPLPSLVVGTALVVVVITIALLAWAWRRRQQREQGFERRIAERTADIVKLGQIGQELTATLDIEQAMDRVWERVAARLDAHVFAISLVDADAGCIREVYVREAGVREAGLEFDLQERGRPAVWCVQHRRELVVGGADELDALVGADLPPKQGSATESLVYLPLVVQQRVIGCLTVQSLCRNAYRGEQIEFLRVLASYTAIALDNAERYARLDRLVEARTADIVALGAVGRALTATLDTEQAMSRVHRCVADVLDAYTFSVGIFDAQAGLIRRDYAVENGVRLPPIEYPLDEVDRPAVWCVREGRELVTRCQQELLRYVRVNLPAKVGTETESIVYLPLLVDGSVRGFLSVQSPRPNAYSEAQLGFLRALASYIAIALDNAASYARLDQAVAARTADIVRLGEIGKELTATLDVEQAMERVYHQVGARLDTHVFAIGLCLPERDCVRIAYLVEGGVRGPLIEFPLGEVDRPAVWCVRERRELVTRRKEDLLEYVQVKLPPVQGRETESIVYLPLVVQERVIGCLTVQSLQADAYSPEQLEFLRVLASYTAIALDNATSYARLDHLVAERTADILALGEIGRELTATLDAETAMTRVHQRVVELLDAHVFSIGIVDEEARTIRRDYAVEGGCRLPPIEYSLDESDRPAVWCVTHGRELITRTTAELRNYVGTVLQPKVGALTESIVYLPLTVQGRVRGFLSVQSLQAHAYSDAQIEFLRVLGSYTAIALENAASFARLDQAVAARTAALSTALADLRATQHTLIEREKMASLGGLVAGIAHEVNTPIGIAVTSASHLHETTRELFAAFDAGHLNRQRLEEFRASALEGLRLIEGSLARARQLIASFKQVAVDQSSEQRRHVDLATVLDEIVFSLGPTHRRAGHQLSLDCAPGIELDTYPGALFQIITNLVTNAVLHAFPDGRRGHMRLQVRAVADGVELRFSDDGVGMPADVAARAFEPFFTTRRGSGGSGLGLHLVYNLATRLLGGRIALHSRVGTGTELVIQLPRAAPVAAGGADRERIGGVNAT